MRCRLAVIALVIAVTTPPMAANADVVTDWNKVTLNVIRAKPLNPPRATRVLAMVHVAIFDALNGVKPKYEHYAVPGPAPKEALASPAAASAAHTVLIGLFPELSEMLDEALATSLADFPDGKGKRRGVEWGTQVGLAILELRSDDGSADVVPYTPSGELGRWKPTPSAFAPALLPNWPFVTPFAMHSGEQFRAPPPPELTSEEHAVAYNEVKLLGENDSAVRTEDQTEIAFFWEDGAGSVTPPGHWHVIAQIISEYEFLDVQPREKARLFALLSIVQADASITCWDSKYFHDIVRPVTNIREEADIDGNDDTEADPTWTPLIPTPPFPSYTSGHSTYSGSSAKLLALFFGTDNIPFAMESPDPQRWPDHLPGTIRSFDSLSEAAEEAGQSRIYGGIHWQYDNTEGRAAGRALAKFVFNNYLRPLKDK